MIGVVKVIEVHSSQFPATLNGMYHLQLCQTIRSTPAFHYSIRRFYKAIKDCRVWLVLFPDPSPSQLNAHARRGCLDLGLDNGLVLSPDLSPSRGKEGLVTLVNFLGIGRTIWEGPIRLLDFNFHVIVTFKTTCDVPQEGGAHTYYLCLCGLCMHIVLWNDSMCDLQQAHTAHANIIHYHAANTILSHTIKR